MEQSSLTDEELVKKSLAGHDEAFNILVRRYQNRVFSLVYRIVNIPENTEDVAQDVFITVYRSLASFRGESAFSTWLYRVTVNHCKNRLKYLQRRNFHRAQDLQETPETSFRASVSMALADPEQQFMARELETTIQKELNALDEDYKIILILRDIEHLSYDAISEISGLALGTVKSRLHRARNALKERMEGYLR